MPVPVRVQKPPVPTQRSRAHGQPALLPPGVHARLKLGAVKDEAERQADRIALRVLRTSSGVAGAAGGSEGQGAGGGAGGGGGWAAGGDGGRSAVRRIVTRSIEPERPRPSIEEEQDLPVSLEREVVSLQAGGEPLPPRVRQDMEGRFGLPFETVRIHIGPDAVRLSESMQAHAFAVGEHIAFNEGCFAPNTAHGRFLLAHELAHVAQQRGGADVAGVEQQPARVRRGFWGDLYDSAAETLGDVADWAVDQVRDFGWRLLETISPEFARTVRAIVDEGILSWLGRQVARAWEGYVATLRALVPFDGPRQLIDLFAGLVERAAAIASAMVSGNCEPLMQAIGELKSFVTETVGVAWDRLTEFLRPVGEFFTGLWADFGAPAAQWLQQFGGDVWEGIQQLGRDFWEWVRPVREAAERVWNWFKEVLFGPADSGDETAGSEGGVIGWISRKAGEAWDWVKERTRPVWQPVADVVAKVAELIPPAFIREMGEHAQQLATQLDGVAGGMDGGEGVPESRDTLASVLPSVEAILGTVRRILVGAGRWLAERVAGVGSVFTQLVGGLRASDLLSWLAGAFGWLEEAVAALVTWANERVSVLFDWLVRGFDALTPFLQLVLETVRKVISIYGDLLQLPLLILNSIWQRVPACIREPVENFIKTQVLARIPVFGQFFSDPELWPRVQQTALNILRRIFVDGDLPGAAWAFFQAVLRIFNVPPELVVQILAKAAGAIGSILTNPLGFLANLLRAMGAGFTGFFSRIGTHLLTGFTGWLFSTVREAGIQPPADFSLRSVLGFVLEVLGVTVDNIFARLARRLDPAIVARLRSMLEVATGVWGFVATLVTEGPAGLWRELTERLSSLWETVVQGVVGFITERVIGWASRWLLSLLDVSGIMPVINTLIAIYRAIESFMEYLRQMLEIVNRVLDGIAGIARGAIEVAAGFVESALSSSLPIVIGFLANQAGLGRLSHRLRETLAGLRERVDAAIDWLIDRALRLGRAVIDMVRRGAAAVRRGAARLRDWWRARREFRVGGQPHSVYVEGSGRSARVMVASDPTPYQTFLGRVKVTPDKEADKQSAITIAGELDAAVATAARDNPGGSASGGVGAAWSASAAAPAAGTPTTTNHADIIDGLLGRLADATARFMPVDITRSTPPVYGARVNGFGSSASVLRLTPIHPNGSSPSSGDMGNPLWGKVAKRKQGEGVYYIKGHLLNDNLGGPGGTWDNLTPLTQAANSDHKNQFEKFAKLAVNGSEGPYSEPTPAQAQARNLKTIQFVVTARYGQTARTSDIAYLRAQGNPDADDKADILEGEQAVPAALDCAAHELLPNGNAGPSVANHTVQNTIDSDLDHYSTRPTPLRIVYLNLMSRDELMSLNGIGPTLADDILRERPFRTRQEMQTKVHIADGRWNQMQSTPGIEVRIFQRG